MKYDIFFENMNVAYEYKGYASALLIGDYRIMVEELYSCFIVSDNEIVVRPAEPAGSADLIVKEIFCAIDENLLHYFLVTLDNVLLYKTTTLPYIIDWAISNDLKIAS